MHDKPLPCPCGRQGPSLRSKPGTTLPLPYAACCGRWHAGPTALQAPDAESLMRSRYSAYVLGLSGYLLATWHPSTRPASLDLKEPGLCWLGLTVKRHLRQDEHHATVAFAARSKQAGRAHRLEETSRFVREGPGSAARWYYVDGEVDGDDSEVQGTGRRA